MKVNICGAEIDPYSFDEVVKAIADNILFGSTPEYVVTPNAHHIVTLQNDAHFRNIYKNAFLVVPDGVSLLWSAKFLNTPLRGRVNGTELFEKLCAVAAEKQLKIFLLGGRPGAAAKAARVLRDRHHTLKIAGTYCPPYGFQTDRAELATINQKIKAAAPDILFVGLGAPKQEKWIYAYYQELNVPISVAIGVSFELVSGMVSRAPKWMQKTGLEWFYRLLAEPRRLWQRYLIGNVLFIWLVIKQRLGFYKPKLRDVQLSRKE